MRITEYFCDYCKKKINIEEAFEDESIFYNKEFCSYECMYQKLKIEWLKFIRKTSFWR